MVISWSSKWYRIVLCVIKLVCFIIAIPLLSEYEQLSDEVSLQTLPPLPLPAKQIYIYTQMHGSQYSDEGLSMQATTPPKHIRYVQQAHEHSQISQIVCSSWIVRILWWINCTWKICTLMLKLNCLTLIAPIMHTAISLINPFHVRFQTELTAFLYNLWEQCAQVCREKLLT